MSLINSKQYLRGVELKRDTVESYDIYPFCLSAIRNLKSLKFNPEVTFIVGENGAGKSTILEAIAVAYGFNAEGGSKNFNFSTYSTHSELYNHIKLIKGVVMPKDGYFLRAESFYNVATNVDELDREDRKLLLSYGGKSLHNQSHGESFFALFMNRFGGNGMYILDEPEAALSPSRQMAMLARIHDLVKKGSQFIISTHSPIIMAYPGATIYQIKDSIVEVDYEETDNYQITRSFMNNRDKILDILLED